MATGLLLFAAYAVYALGKNSPGPESPEKLKFWAIAMLIFIGIGIAASMVVQILFHIAFSIGIAVKERESDDKTVERIITSSMVEDEMDKLIGLKSAHIGYICAGIGFIAALAVLAFGLSAVFALHILFGSFAAGSIIEGGMSVYFYERGLQGGTANRSFDGCTPGGGSRNG
jgi:hypothetical protein